MKNLPELAITIILSLATAVPAFADEVSKAIADNSHAMTLQDDRLTGPGARILKEEVSSASVLCIGESHLNNETPALIGAMLPWLSESGYTALAIETGQRIAEYSQSEFPDNRESLAKLFAEVPFTAAFIDHTPEFELFGAAVDHDLDLWGLDQVFMGGARFNLAQLVELAPNNDARDLAQGMLDKENKAFVRFAQTRDESGAFLFSTTPRDYDRLRRAFDSSDEAQTIIDELQASARIYQLYKSGENYESNLARTTLMKQHLARHASSLAENDKIVMKFGSIHMGRGYSILNQLDLGNAAAELANMRGGHSLHIYVASQEFATNSPPIAEIIKALPDDAQWHIIDLRPLRPIFHDERKARGHEELAELAWRFDMIALTKAFTDADTLPGVPTLSGN